MDNMSQNVVKAQYAVRGEIVTIADQLAHQLREARLAGRPHNMPFNEIIYCNIGNPQSLGQAPITFFRQVLALTTYPELLKTARDLFPADAIARAEQLLKYTNGAGTGAYSHSAGIEGVRRSVADFIHRRDGHPSEPDHIFLSNGASSAISACMQCIVRGPGDGVMIPIPQYPLYTASIALDESTGWGMRVSDLRAAVQKARQSGVTPRCIVVINPGNPTGQILNRDIMAEVVKFCHEERIVLLADEVYQENVWASGKTFVSFKKVLRESGDISSNSVELFSFHSVSKGFVGECGRRGGYVEATNIHADVLAQLYKLRSISLCPNTDGQIMTELMVNPPKPGEASYAQYVSERDNILNSLRRRAQAVQEGLNKLEGVSCQPAEGAMYLFPTITLPAKAVQAAKAAGKAPDAFYCAALLQATGVVVVPGSGFGQKAGTWHFRCTILPPEAQIASVLEKLSAFHRSFMANYA
jgi:alanine transaminase